MTNFEINRKNWKEIQGMSDIKREMLLSYLFGYYGNDEKFQKVIAEWLERTTATFDDSAVQS